MLRRLVVPIVLLVAGLVFVPGLANAGKPSKPSNSTGSSSITLNQSDPRLGGSASFTVTYPTTAKNPRVAVYCYQGGTLGYAEAGTYDNVFTLGGAGSDWQRGGGAANCSAELFYFTYQGGRQSYHNLAWTYFDAAG